MKIPEFTLERFFDRYEFTAPFLLCCSDVESFTPAEIMSLSGDHAVHMEAFKHLRLGYTDTKGGPELRKAITTLYTHADMDDILVHSGAEEGIFNFMNAALEPGDNIVVQVPCYQSLFEIAAAGACSVTPLRLNLSEKRDGKGRLSYQMDLDDLKKCITPKTKALVINFPHNPTGFALDHDTLKAMVKIAEENNIFIFSDEVYRFSEYDADKRPPAAADMTEKGVSLGVMSKSFGLAGLRIGWIYTKDPSLYKKIAAFKDYTSICNSAPSEFLATLALQSKEAILKRNNRIIQENLKILEAFFLRHEDLFEWIPPTAGPIAFPALKNGGSSDDFAQKLVDEKGVLLMPGSVYNNELLKENAIGKGFDVNAHFRIGFGRKNMPECLEKFERFISE